ncbi:MAG TPA: type II secretion system F family protein [Candidatus Thalassarchaeaceae archaeon]|jgi:pilus assembly protein TadC|nr:type II secretion system F family protein [Candidatus Thalassarchaeaceae archaeon]HJM87466.1 type II secretion system F family protein [Candidatus Thalassarchaeaceae archaeon]
MAIGISGFLDMVTDSLLISFFIPLTIISIGGGLPFVLENRRLKKLENGLPELLEGISTSLGAGLGLQQAITSLSEQRNDVLGSLLRRAIGRSKVTTFDAAISEFAVESRSQSIQRAFNLLQTADENEAPLQDVTFSMSLEYDRLLRLRNKRELDLQGQSLMLKGLMAILLPATIGMMFGLFAGPQSGIPMDLFHPSMLMYFTAGSAFSVLVSAVMVGKTIKSAVWWIAPWALAAQIVYMGSYLVSSIMV